jgi:hypothetical protein
MDSTDFRGFEWEKGRGREGEMGRIGGGEGIRSHGAM